MTGPLTAFVSHPDCARHDTGWKHPDHQGRLPALMRAVYRDMLTLHGSLREVEGVPATEEALLRVHTREHLDAIRKASSAADTAGGVRHLVGDVYVSGASWDAARAAAGTAITGAEMVLRAEASNAFCAARPPGRAALPAAPAGHALVNSVVITARHLRTLGVGRVLIVDWAGANDSAVALAAATDDGICVLALSPSPAPAVTASGGRARAIGLPERSTGAVIQPIFEAALDEAVESFDPEFILLSTGFDVLAGDPIGRLAVEPAEIHPLTNALVERAVAVCGGRLVSVLDGGYEAAALGPATVQHLRALCGLPPA